MTRLSDDSLKCCQAACKAAAESRRSRLSCAEAVELEGVAHEVAHDLLRPEDAERATCTRALPEAVRGREGIWRGEQERYAMPGVALQLRRRRVVACNGEGVGAEVQQHGYPGVYFLDHGGLPVEVPVLACGVCGLDVDEEEVVVVPVRLQGLEFSGDAFALLQELHPGEAGQSLVHRIARDSGRVELVGLLERGEGGVHPEAAHEDGVRRLLVTQDLVRLLDEGVRDL